MSKFKVGDKVRVIVSDELNGLHKGVVHTVVSVHPMGNIELMGISTIQWSPDRFELIQEDSVLTPEEVFTHLHKGTKLQVRHTGKVGHKDWCDVLKPELTTYEVMVVAEWRIKPEPEVIELNGKKYREIIE